MIARPHSIVLDTGALSALADGSRAMQAWAEVARRTDSVLYASTVTLAEATDGSAARDTRLRIAAKAVRLLDVTPDLGYSAGALRAKAAGRRKARDATIDALIAATAAAVPAPAVVLTSDVGDLGRLLSGTAVVVERV